MLNEYYATVTRKLNPGLDVRSARDDVASFDVWRPLALDGLVLRGAWLVEDESHIAFWDALIVAAAQRLHCSHVLSEDLTDGQVFGVVEVVNPFAREPSDIGLA